MPTQRSSTFRILAVGHFGQQAHSLHGSRLAHGIVTLTHCNPRVACAYAQDVVRTRLMVGVGGGAAETWAAAIKAGGLFSGLGTRVFYIGTSSAVFFVVYEAIKVRLGVVTASSSPAAIGKAKRQQ